MRAVQRVGGCERCLTPKYDIQKDNGSSYPSWKQLQTAHFWGRRKISVRFDPDNAIGICGACHLHLTANPQEQVEFFKARLGDRFDLLNSRMRTPARYLDKAALTIYLNIKIQELENK